MKYYKRYPGDYMRDTGHLTLREHGAYSLLLDHAYTADGCIPNSIEAAYRICRAMTKPDRAAVRAVVERFFQIEPKSGLRTNPRVVREFEKYRTQVEHNAQVSHLGVAARRKLKEIREGSNPGGNPEATRDTTRSEPGSQPDPAIPGDPEATLSRIQKPDSLLSASGEASTGRRSALANAARKIGKHKNGTNGTEPEESRLAKALLLLKAQPDFPLAKLASMYHLTESRLREAAAA